MRKFLFLLIFCVSGSIVLSAQAAQAQLEKLATEVSRDTGITNRKILDAVVKTDRAVFVPEGFFQLAYRNVAIPAGDGFIPSVSDIINAVGFLEISPQHTVLITGSNCGYAAALISGLCRKVYLAEESPAAESYRDIFKNLGLENIETMRAAASEAFPEELSFDRIFIQAAGPAVPGSVTERLSLQGNLVFAASRDGEFQQLIMLKRSILGTASSAEEAASSPNLRLYLLEIEPCFRALSIRSIFL